MRTSIGALLAALLLTAAVPASALTRYSSSHPFFARTAVSGIFGVGVPVGEFSSSRNGDGNHKAGAFDWSAEIEHYFMPGLSLGVALSHTTYTDKTYGDLKTNLSLFGAFLRYVIDTGGPAYPFMRVGAGTVEVKFEDPTTRSESDHAGTVQVGGGGLFMLGRNVSIDASAMYTFGFTDNTPVDDPTADPNTLVVVGFDVQYWTFAGGLTIYFP